MSNSNKTYRINTKVGVDNNDNINLNLNVLQKYDILEILSLKIGTESIYKTHTSGYGCVVGRVLANGGIGVPNAKISIFIEANENTNEDEVYIIYIHTKQLGIEIVNILDIIYFQMKKFQIAIKL